MTKIALQQKAVALRKLGYSYNEIREKVIVSKSSLSLWLRSVGLTKRQVQRLTDKKRTAQKKAIQAVRTYRIEKTKIIKERALAEIPNLSEREKWFIGIALYWAEGSKERERSSQVKFSNIDPGMVLFFREWMFDFLKANPGDLTYRLYIHEKSAERLKAIKFWTKLLNIDPYELKISLKRHNPSPKRKNIGIHYVGVMQLVLHRSADINRKISGWINGIISRTKVIGE